MENPGIDVEVTTGGWMMRGRWHVLQAGDALIVARRLPVRFDISAAAVLPQAGALRLAHQVRQDVWRALRRLRGFSPAVRVTPLPGGGLHVLAGGQVDGPVPRARAEAALQEVLGDAGNRRRWLRWAR